MEKCQYLNELLQKKSDMDSNLKRIGCFENINNKISLNYYNLCIDYDKIKNIYNNLGYQCKIEQKKNKLKQYETNLSLIKYQAKNF